jgi:hypothetical protein
MRGGIHIGRQNWGSGAGETRKGGRENKHYGIAIF